MKYLLNIGGVLLFQLISSYALMQLGTGGGSFVGLGVMLLAVYGIPLTIIINLILMLRKSAKVGKALIVQCMLVGLVLPVIQAGLYLVVAIFDL